MHPPHSRHTDTQTHRHANREFFLCLVSSRTDPHDFCSGGAATRGRPRRLSEKQPPKKGPSNPLLRCTRSQGVKRRSFNHRGLPSVGPVLAKAFSFRARLSARRPHGRKLSDLLVGGFWMRFSLSEFCSYGFQEIINLSKCSQLCPAQFDFVERE